MSPDNVKSSHCPVTLSYSETAHTCFEGEESGSSVSNANSNQICLFVTTKALCFLYSSPSPCHHDKSFCGSPHDLPPIELNPMPLPCSLPNSIVSGSLFPSPPHVPGNHSNKQEPPLPPLFVFPQTNVRRQGTGWTGTVLFPFLWGSPTSAQSFLPFPPPFFIPYNILLLYTSEIRWTKVPNFQSIRRQMMTVMIIIYLFNKSKRTETLPPIK